MSTLEPGSTAPGSVPPPLDPRPPARGNGVGLAALIVGIVALVLAVVPIVSFFAGLPALVAIVLGIVGLVLRGRRRAAAAAGLAVGIVAMIVAIVVSTIAVVGFVGKAGSALSSQLPTDFSSGLPTDLSTALPSGALGTPLPTIRAGRHTVVYTVTGDGTAAISYGAVAGGRTGSARAASTSLPFTRTASFTSAANDFASFTLAVAATEATRPITCSISLDGVVVSTKTVSSKPFAFAICAAHSG